MVYLCGRKKTVLRNARTKPSVRIFFCYSIPFENAGFSIVHLLDGFRLVVIISAPLFFSRTLSSYPYLLDDTEMATVKFKKYILKKFQMQSSSNALCQLVGLLWIYVCTVYISLEWVVKSVFFAKCWKYMNYGVGMDSMPWSVSEQELCRIVFMCLKSLMQQKYRLNTWYKYGGVRHIYFTASFLSGTSSCRAVSTKMYFSTKWKYQLISRLHHFPRQSLSCR